ncbi:MAG: 5-(carboxyamino)imidazole ribonucleotide synthase [Nitrososphaera sp.]|nr:5-(carboxyamino)imidazole ribonucleotide synthase [Nitrososphaera sp.]
MAVKSDIFSSDRPACIGIIGGGQLGKMIAHEARRMSLKIIVLDPTECCPAAKLADEQIIADFKDESAILELASKCDVITYEIELASSSALKQLESRKYPVRPAPETLRIIQNKYRQKSFLRNNHIPVPRFELVNSETHLLELCNKFGLPAMLKACEDSYDGRGNFLIDSKNKAREGLRYFSGRECMLEEYVPFAKEISIMVARNPGGQIKSFPVAENIHRNSILDATIVPARIPRRVELKAKRVAEKTMDVLKDSGIFGIEMFVTRHGDILVNEIAPRPHNSGHYTNEACSVSQFEQHLRAVLDLPLSTPELLSPAAMVNILGPNDSEGPYALRGAERLLSTPGVKLYIYGKKSSRPRRKLGHITATARTPQAALRRARKAREMIKMVSTAGGKD